MIANRAGAKFLHVPYQGDAPALGALLADQVQFTLATPTQAIGNIQGGKVRALAVTGNTRMPAVPDAPTMEEATGFKDFDVRTWFGLAAPAGVPGAIVEPPQRGSAQGAGGARDPRPARADRRRGAPEHAAGISRPRRPRARDVDQGGRRHQAAQTVRATTRGLESARPHGADHRRIERHRARDREVAGGGRLPPAPRRAHRVRARQGRRRRSAPATTSRSPPIPPTSPTARRSRRSPPPAADVDILVNSAGGIPRGTLARDRRGEMAARLGPQGVRLHQPDARDLRPDVPARQRRDHQHRRPLRRPAGRLLHRRQLGQRRADHVLALARRRQHPPRRAGGGGESGSGRDREAHPRHRAAGAGKVRRQVALARRDGGAADEARGAAGGGRRAWWRSSPPITPPTSAAAR